HTEPHQTLGDVYPVEQRYDHRAIVRKEAKQWRRLVQVIALYRKQSVVGADECARIVCGIDRHAERLGGRPDGEATSPHRIEVSSSGEERNVIAMSREKSGDVAADGSSADNRATHCR